MKTICSRWSVLALVLGATACSADTGESGPGTATDLGDPPNLDVPPAVGPEGAAPRLRAAPPKVDPGSPVKPTAVAKISGIVTDLGGGVSRLGLGGKGTLAAAAAVRLSELTAGGQLRVLAEVGVDVSGNFSAD